LAIPYRTLLDLKMSRVKHLRAGRLGCATSVQKKSSTEIRRRLLRRKESRQFIARATQQVFPLCQPAIPLSQQLELRLQRDLSQSLQAQWWEPELLQE
jgi:hypothetical protein